jgi:phage regulator Rha-like protein
MSSLEIAELTGKQHKDVIRDIRVMRDALEKDGANLRHVIEDFDGRGYTSCFHLNRTLTETLITGYSIPLRHKVILRLQELEAGSARFASLTDPRIDMIASLLDRGLITKAQADQRVMQLLDDAIPLSPRPQGDIYIAQKVMKIESKETGATARPSGAGVIALQGNQKMRLSEMGQWVMGGQRVMMATLVAAGLIAESGRPTPKGSKLFAGSIKGSCDVHVYAEALLRAIGAWPKQ